MKVSNRGLAFLGTLLALHAPGCGDGSQRPSSSETTYTLSCPESGSSCGDFAEATCVQPPGTSSGVRAFVGEDGGVACDGSALTVTCSSRTNSHFTHPTSKIVAEVSVGDEFAIAVEMWGEVPPIENDEVGCEVRVTENGVVYSQRQERQCQFYAGEDELGCTISRFHRSDETGLTINLECEALRGSRGSLDLDAELRFPQCEIVYEEPDPSTVGL